MSICAIYTAITPYLLEEENWTRNMKTCRTSRLPCIIVAWARSREAFSGLDTSAAAPGIEDGSSTMAAA